MAHEVASQVPRPTKVAVPPRVVATPVALGPRPTTLVVLPPLRPVAVDGPTQVAATGRLQVAPVPVTVAATVAAAAPKATRVAGKTIVRVAGTLPTVTATTRKAATPRPAIGGPREGVALTIPAVAVPATAGQEVPGLVPTMAAAAAQATATRTGPVAGVVAPVAATAALSAAATFGAATVVTIPVAPIPKATTAELAIGPFQAVGRPWQLEQAPILAVAPPFRPWQALAWLVQPVAAAAGAATDAREVPGARVVGPVTAAAARPVAPTKGRPALVLVMEAATFAGRGVPKAIAAEQPAAPLAAVAADG